MAARSCYEVLVETLVSPATLATVDVAVRLTPVPRRTLRRLRVGADCDIAELVRRLTDNDVELLEIRRCTEPRAPRHRSPEPPPGPHPDAGDRSAGVVVPLPAVRPPSSTGPVQVSRARRSRPRPGTGGRC
jgi:hypothetical protein